MIDHEDGGSNVDNNEEEDIDDNDGEEDEDLLDVLNEEDREQLLENTVVVRTTLNKVCTIISCFFSIYSHLFIFYIRKLSFAIIHSTTIALPAWRTTCTTHKLPVRLIPRDVTTRWNSTYDMAKVAVKYRPAINDITANKSLKLRKYELDDDDWKIIRDLIKVLKVCLSSSIVAFRC
jgi:hypothetical protein